MSPDLSNNGSLNHRYLIKNAYAILTGLSGMQHVLHLLISVFKTVKLLNWDN